MTYRNKVICISDIWELLSDRIDNTPELYSFSVGDDEIFDEQFVKSLIETDYISRSFKNMNENPVYGFEKLWITFRLKHDSEFIEMWNAVNSTYNPLNEYSETRTTTPNITAATTNTYGRTSTNSGGITTQYGKTETVQTNTYDGSLRDSGKSTAGGSDTSTNTLTNTLGGTDSSTTATTGTSTETITGYKDSAAHALEKDISFKLRYNVADNFIKSFMNEYTFYDNDNAKGCQWYGILY